MDKYRGTVYVLKLQLDKYYIGITRQLEHRIFEHFTKQGSKWTRLYPPIELLETIEEASHTIEDYKTLEYMMRCGWQNVRGGRWWNPFLTSPPFIEWDREDKPTCLLNIKHAIDAELIISRTHTLAL